MKRLPLVVVALLLGCSKTEPETPKPQAPAASAPAASPAAPAPVSEKDKALAQPYPNDLGPERLAEAVVAAYPAPIKEGYELLLKRCAQCHTAARPLNSRFVEVPDKAALSVAVSQFKDPAVWQIEDGVWNRYVKRMMAKPGCAISQAEGKKIWEFLVFDGERRKLGASAEAWKAHRQKLVAEFQARHPARYAELKAANDL